jgi:hypothetical protein
VGDAPGHTCPTSRPRFKRMNEAIAALLADKPRAWIEEQAHFKIEQINRQGPEGRASAAVVRRLIAPHKPTNPGHALDVHSGPCDACGDPWPCKTMHMPWTVAASR